MPRDAAPADAEAIARVEVRAWQAAYQRSVGPRYLAELSVGLRASAWEGRLDGARVVEHEGAVVGVCAVAVVEPVLEVRGLYVDPACWQRGFGRELLGDAIGRSAGAAWEHAEAWLFLHNAIGRSAFARLGFRLSGDKRQDPATHADEVLLRKPR